MKKGLRIIMCFALCFVLLLPTFCAYADGEDTQTFDDNVRLSLELDKTSYRPGGTAVLTVYALGLDDERSAGVKMIDMQTYIRFSDDMVASCEPVLNPSLDAVVTNESEKAFQVSGLHSDVLVLYFYLYDGAELQELADEDGRLMLGTVSLQLENATGKIFAEFAEQDEDGKYGYGHFVERAQDDSDMPKTMVCETGTRVEAFVEEAAATYARRRRRTQNNTVDIGEEDTPKVDTPFGPVVQFEDIDDYPWAQDAIYELRAKGIIEGVSDTRFAPQNNITRGDFVLILSRMLQLEGSAEDNFPDVPEDSYYYTAIGRAKAAGIALGYGVDFMPERTVSRQELITLAYRAFLRYGYMKEAANVSALEPFADKDDMHGYARVPLASMISAGIIEGAGGYLTPLDNATRAETAVMCSRLMNLIETVEAAEEERDAQTEAGLGE